MTLLIASFAILILGGAAVCIPVRDSRFRFLVGTWSATLGSLAGLAGACIAILKPAPETITLPWALPMFSLRMEMDPLSSFFLIVIFGLSLLCAIYGRDYMWHADSGNRSAFSWLWFNLLIVSMTLVVVARNGVLFILAWEVMSLTSFFLVAHDHLSKKVRHAAWVYLVATHIGTAFLLAMFILAGAEAGSMDFESFSVLKSSSQHLRNVLFIFALIGFGTKAGLYPLHVWLPEAHPAAPSHVSALMSGVMIKTGIYALIRFISILGDPEPWWGWVLIGAGAVSGILGVVFALAQHDLKKLLAYHSVENIGIISLGLGIGVLGWSMGQPLIMVAGFAGGILHVLNHAVFKGLLFLCAGSVLHATGSRNMEQMGGLLKRMPVTGTSFLVGAVAISGLPPFNGFVSEFLIYVAAICGIMSTQHSIVLPSLVIIGSLALIGGLATACFTKAFGIVFLGEPRNAEFTGAKESGFFMRIPMAVLVSCCLGIALLAPLGTPMLVRIIGVATSIPTDNLEEECGLLVKMLFYVSAGSAGLIVAVAALAMLRKLLLRGRVVGAAATWGCGYARPTVKMQYTASSFAQPITGMFSAILRPRRQAKLPDTYFPVQAGFETHTDDTAYEQLYRRIFSYVDRGFSRFRWIQEGRVQVYLLYLALTLVLLLLIAL